MAEHAATPVSKNPFDYKPAEIAKALVALGVTVVALLGLAATVFVDGPLAVVGASASAAALFANPILVFLKQAVVILGFGDETPTV